MKNLTLGHRISKVLKHLQTENKGLRGQIPTRSGGFMVGGDAVFVKVRGSDLCLLGLTSGGRLLGDFSYLAGIPSGSEETRAAEDIDVASHWNGILARNAPAGLVRRSTISGGSGFMSAVFPALGFGPDGLDDAVSRGPRPGDHPVLSRIIGAVDIDVLRLFRGTPNFSHADYEWASSGDVLADRRRKFLGAYPLPQSAALGRSGIDAMLSAGADDEDVVVRALVVGGFVDEAGLAKPSAVKRLKATIATTSGMRPISGHPANPAGYARNLLAPERMPSTHGEWEAFMRLYPVARGFSAGDGAKLTRLLDIPRGEYRAALGRLLHVPYGKKMLGLRDTETAVRTSHEEISRLVADLVVAPALTLSRRKVDRVKLLKRTGDAVFRDKSLTGCIEVVDRFHLHNEKRANAFGILCEKREIRWGHPGGEKEFEIQGYRMRWLTTPQELIDEGSAWPDREGVEGLDHCVAGYVEQCMKGNTFVVSVRDAAGKKRLATVEFGKETDADGRQRIQKRQERGFRNAEVVGEDHMAVMALEARLSPERGMPPVSVSNPVIPAGIVLEHGSVFGLVSTWKDVALMYEGISDLLPRHMRGLGRADMVAAFRTIARPLAVPVAARSPATEPSEPPRPSQCA